MDIFIDLSRAADDETPRLITELSSCAGPAALGGSVTCVFPHSGTPPAAPAGWRVCRAPDALRAAALAVEAAATRNRPIVFLLGAFVPSVECLAALREIFERDPLFGFAVPRMASSDGCGIEPVFPLARPDENAVLPRRALADLPEVTIVPEMLGPCIVLRSALPANLPFITKAFQSVAGALLHFLAQARRIGFRGVLANRVVAPCCGAETRTDTPDQADVWELLRSFPEATRSHVELTRVPQQEHERLLSRAYSIDRRIRYSLLLDATAMNATFNGTSECVLGFAFGLQELSHQWAVTVLANPKAIKFHDLERRFPDATITADPDACRASVAFKLSQPWAFETMLELHRRALLNYYLVLDTIAWDTLLGAPEHLEDLWRFSSQYADGLLYISNFTRDRFRARFPLAVGVREETLHLSLHPNDYVRWDVRKRRKSAPEFFLVVGNSYDHKDLVRTVDTLASCFPLHSICALGLERASHPNVNAIPSGDMPVVEMERLYAEARLIVFPSFYEGFGFPIVRGLSYGRPVVARDSSLLHELAALYRGPGRLFSFSTHLELADVVGKLLRGEAQQELTLGVDLLPGAEPVDWKAIAARMLEVFEQDLVEPAQGSWLARELAFRQMTAYKR